MNRLVLLVALVALSGCPKENTGKETATPTPAPSATPVTMTTGTSGMMGSHTLSTPAPAASATPAATPQAKDVTAVRYTWGGGLSPFHHYALDVKGDVAKFSVKPMRSDLLTLEDKLSPEDVKLLAKLIDDTKFFDATTAPRKVRIMDIGESTITVWKDGKTNTVSEGGTTVASSDIKALRKWLDDKVRLYLEKSGAKQPRPTPTPAK